MKPIQLLKIMAFLVCIASLPLAHASDFTGVYARIDKVVLEPSSGEPERIQVWGVFAVAKPNDRNDYVPAARGYLYLKLDRNPQATRNEWSDMKQVAGSGEVVAFGARGQESRLRKADEKPQNPDSYTVNFGLVKVRGRTDYAPVKSLLEFHD
jgi:hypothetical protein